MKNKIRCLKNGALFLLSSSFFMASALAGFIYNDFESSADPSPWSGHNSLCEFSTEQVKSGSFSWKMSSSSDWNYGFVPSHKEPHWNVDFTAGSNDRLSFWVYGIPIDSEEYFVRVKFYDQGNYNLDGAELLSSQKLKVNEWTRLSVFLKDLPSDFDLTRVDKVEFKNERAGTYYFDDIHVVREDKIYQSFDRFPTEDCGWIEGGNVYFGLNGGGEPTYEGSHALKVVVNDSESRIGIRNEYFNHSRQSYWYADLCRELNDRLTFQIYAVPEPGKDNDLGKSVEVQFFDQVNYKVDSVNITPEPIETNEQWVKVTIPFSEFPNDFAFDQIDKIMIHFRWPGTYYIDSLKACRKSGLMAYHKEEITANRLLWDSVPGASHYRLEEQVGQRDWTPVSRENDGWVPYDDNQRFYEIPHITGRYYRIVFNETLPSSHEIPYSWDYSKPIEFTPPQVVLSHEEIMNGVLAWTEISTDSVNYEVEVSDFKVGSVWEPALPAHLTGEEKRWFRVRAVKDFDGTTEATDWSRPICNKNDFLQVKGTRIQDVSGNEVTLRGVNLGGNFLIERWMTGLGNEATLKDDYSIREELQKTNDEDVLDLYEDTFSQIIDLDIMADMGISLLRLPIYYRQIMNEEGDFLPEDEAFRKIDWVINECANRNIYVLLDLHGAPGGQSSYDHCGREGDLNSNMLFLFEYHQSQTVLVWEKIANRYKGNSNVMGYDLLNEPVGFWRANQGYGPLWSLYARIYNAVRAIDSNHIIVMEGAFGWDTLPDPETYSWENVIYQFHWYPSINNVFATAPCFNYDMEAMFEYHKTQLQEKMNETLVFQEDYNIPVMIGEFNCYESKESWEYHLNLFNENSLSWTMWTYKTILPNSFWGFVNYGGAFWKGLFPDFENDQPEVIADKFETFDTYKHFSKNDVLIDTISPFLNVSSKATLVASYSFDEVVNNQVVDLTGNGFNADLLGDLPLSDDAVRGNSMAFSTFNYLQAEGGNPLAGAETFTVALWFKRHLDDPQGTLPNIKFLSSAEWHGGFDATGWNVGLHYPEGWADNQRGSIHQDGNQWDRSVLGQYPLSDKWNQLVIVYDGERIKEYLNGELSVDLPGTGLPLGTGRPYMRIGCWEGFFMNGLMDEIQIYKGAQTAQEVKDIYDDYYRGMPKEPELVAHYTFDAIENNQVMDVSGNGYDAEVVGSLSVVGDSVQGNSVNFSSGNYLQTNGGNPLAGAENFTVSLWFKTTLSDPQGTLPNIKFLSSAEWHGGANATGWNVGLHYPEGWADNQEGSIHQEGNVWDRSVLGQYPLSDEWNHLAIVYDGLRVKEYLNGTLSVDLPGTSRALGSGRPYMKIGSWRDSFYMNGQMDEVTIYRNALVESQIQELYAVKDIPQNLWEGSVRYSEGHTWRARYIDRSLEGKGPFQVKPGDLFELHFTLTNGNAVSFDFSVDGGENNPTFSHTFFNVEGEHTVQMVADENVDLDRISAQLKFASNEDNVEITVHSIKRIDSEVPIARVEPLGGLEMVNDTITIELTQQEGMWVELDASSSIATQEGGMIESYHWSSSSFDDIDGSSLLTRLGLGTHVISLTVFDGVKYSLVREVTVDVVDTVAPSLTILSPKEGRRYRKKYLTLNISTRVADASGACQLEYRLNGVLLSNNQIDLMAADPVNTLEVTATDSSGNNTSRSVSFRVS